VSYGIEPGSWKRNFPAPNEQDQSRKLANGESQIFQGRESGASRNNNSSQLRIAVIFNGEFNGIDEMLVQNVKAFDVYVSTYKEYEIDAMRVSTNRSRMLLYSRDEVPCMSVPIFQWWHLNQVIRNFRTELESYDLILKLRADLRFYRSFRSSDLAQTPHGCLQMNSDHSFYADPETFFKVYDGFYDDIFNKYYDRNAQYFPLNWRNFKETIKNIYEDYQDEPVNLTHRECRRDIKVPMRHLVYPRAIFTRNFNKLLENIKNLEGEPDLTLGFANLDVGCVPFAAEKYHLINALNKVPICPNRIPAIGIQGNHSDRNRVVRTVPCNLEEVICLRKQNS